MTRGPGRPARATTVLPAGGRARASRAEGIAAVGQRALAERYRAVRARTLDLCRPLSAEDCGVQSMPEASPAKWHLAHTTWFFEAFFLAEARPGNPAYRPGWSLLFNSYYEALGPRHDRARRGLLTRPSLDEVKDYRAHVDRRVEEWFDGEESSSASGALGLLELGLHHEQQHQELLLTDLQHAFFASPLRPVYRPPGAERPAVRGSMRWIPRPGGLVEIGHAGEGFSFDNERPRHEVLLHPHALASRPVTCGEFLGFVDDGGYTRPSIWMSDGWATAQREGWTAPLYWERRGDGWWRFTLGGVRPVREDEPVCHVSWYEADAYARWANARLPREEEWEAAAASLSVAGNFAEDGDLRPRPVPDGGTGAIAGLFGHVWEWTASPYGAYPGYRPEPGAIGEYNGKFMCNQMVLRGGSCASPRSHLRASYRNFFFPNARWQFSGFRLARDG